MKQSDIHSMLFRGVISQLSELYGHQGERLARESWDNGISFLQAFQPRPAQNFTHNYERDKFLHNRDKFILLGFKDSSMILVKCYRRDKITMYTGPLERVFGREHNKFVSVLEKLLRKFYDEVTVETWSTLSSVDVSTGRHPAHQRVYNEV